MFKPEIQAKLKWWPSLQDYNEAIQLHHLYVADEQLKSARPYENAIGLPRAVTGAFSTVYRLESATRDLAFKLFLRIYMIKKHVTRSYRIFLLKTNFLTLSLSNI